SNRKVNFKADENLEYVFTKRCKHSLRMGFYQYFRNLYSIQRRTFAQIIANTPEIHFTVIAGGLTNPSHRHQIASGSLLYGSWPAVRASAHLQTGRLAQQGRDLGRAQGLFRLDADNVGMSVEHGCLYASGIEGKKWIVEQAAGVMQQIDFLLGEAVRRWARGLRQQIEGHLPGE